MCVPDLYFNEVLSRFCSATLLLASHHPDSLPLLTSHSRRCLLEFPYYTCLCSCPRSPLPPQQLHWPSLAPRRLVHPRRLHLPYLDPATTPGPRSSSYGHSLLTLRKCISSFPLSCAASYSPHFLNPLFILSLINPLSITRHATRMPSRDSSPYVRYTSLLFHVLQLC